MARPRKYNKAEEMEGAIDLYFTENGKPTITGLALHLGFESRQSLYAYEKEQEFSYTVKKARLRIENAYENKLHDSACTGAIFALKNMGWTDKSEMDHRFPEGVQFIFEKVPSLIANGNGNGHSKIEYETK